MDKVHRKVSHICWLVFPLLAILAVMLATAGLLVATKNKESRSGCEHRPPAPVICKNAKDWLNKDAVFYNPDFLDYNYQSGYETLERTILSEQVSGVFQHFNAMIVNCPSTNTSNYTEHEMDLVSILSETKSNTKKFSKNSNTSVWFQLGPGNLESCVSLAKAANKKQPGTVQGIVVTNELFLDIAIQSNLSLLPFQSLADWWKSQLATTFQSWERHGLSTGLMMDTLFCMALERHALKGFMKSFSAVFYLGETPSRLAIADGTSVITLSENFLACRKRLKGQLELKLAIHKKIIPRLAVSRPFCLL